MTARKRPQAPPEDNRPPIAVSYLRFSSIEQRKGDSVRRQTEGTEKWCEKNGIPLDHNLSCLDAGKSAFHGDHRSDKAALGNFLELVKAGKVPRGSYLIIENLDRLSREDERTALRLWIDILDAGINIVQLQPETIFRHERSDMTDIIRAIIELSRGHSESRMKSVRSAANWNKAFDLAREGQEMPPRRKDGRRTKAITSRLPSWVVDRSGRLELIPERAAVVRRLFEMAAAGYGNGSIVKKLVAEGVPAFGDRVPDDDGHFKKADGKPFGCGEWRTSYIRDILSDRRALGEFQPRDNAGKAIGDPIQGYYPAAVSEREFLLAQTGAASRRNPPGRIGQNVANLFGGLLRNARDGSTYYAATRSERGKSYRVLLNQSSIEGQSKAFTFQYAVFERALLSELREIQAEKVLGSGANADVDVLRSELEWVRGKKDELTAELLKGDVAAIGAALRSLEARETDLAAKLNAAAEQAVRPLTDTFQEAQTLADLLDTADDPEDVRLRLRAALRRVIDSVWVLVVPRGWDRLAEVQVWFTGQKGYRSYTIIHRPAKGNQNKLQPARYWVGSIKQPEAAAGMPFNVEDLRDPDQAACVRGFLERYPADMIDKLLAEQGKTLP